MAAKNEHGLTPQQERFAQLVGGGASGVDAYRQAYPKSKGWKDNAVRVNASKLIADANISLRIKAIQDAGAERAELDAAEIVREIRRLAISDIAGIMHPNGTVKLPHELDPATRAAVASFKIDEYGRIEYKFWPKNAALEQAAKIKGLYKEDNKQKGEGAAAFLAGLKSNVVGVAKEVPDDDE